METIHLTPENTEEAVAEAAQVLTAGGVILYPTDTLYGLGAAAFSDAAVSKVYEIKERSENKPIHCVVGDLAAASAFAEVSPIAEKLAAKFLPGALTLILKKRSEIDSGIAKNMDTVGIRIPDNQFCISLAKAFGAYTTTSANVAGAWNMRSVEEILEQLGDRAFPIDLVIDAGKLEYKKPSTVVDISSGEIKILREGAILAQDINI